MGTSEGKRSARNTKYTFVLKNVRCDSLRDDKRKERTRRDPKRVSKGIRRDPKRSEIPDDTVITYESSDVEYEQSTAISDIPRSIQEKRKMIATMYDVQRGVIMPLATDLPCWWCRYEFSNPPLGGPTVYHPNSSDDPKRKREIDRYFRDLNINSDTNDYFESEGIFCSFPCMKAYFINEAINGRLKNSLTLITLLHSKLCGSRVCPQIPRAPDWRLLERHGGPLTIEEFRNAHPRFTYRPSVNVKRPFSFPSALLFEQIERVIV